MITELPGDLQSERSCSNAFIAGQCVNGEGETELVPAWTAGAVDELPAAPFPAGSKRAPDVIRRPSLRD